MTQHNSIWNEEKSKRFQQLRSGELERTLTQSERVELDGLVKDLEDWEASYLAPSIQATREERLRLEAENAVLKQLAERRARLAERMEQALSEFTQERKAIDEELARVLPDEFPAPSRSNS